MDSSQQRVESSLVARPPLFIQTRLPYLWSCMTDDMYVAMGTKEVPLLPFLTRSASNDSILFAWWARSRSYSVRVHA